MEPVTKINGIVLPIDRPNVDTDAIIPKQFLKSIKRTGFGVYLFDEWRYLDKGEADSRLFCATGQRGLRDQPGTLPGCRNTLGPG